MFAIYSSVAGIETYPSDPETFNLQAQLARKVLTLDMTLLFFCEGLFMTGDVHICELKS